MEREGEMSLVFRIFKILIFEYSGKMKTNCININYLRRHNTNFILSQLETNHEIESVYTLDVKYVHHIKISSLFKESDRQIVQSIVQCPIGSYRRILYNSYVVIGYHVIQPVMSDQVVL